MMILSLHGLTLRRLLRMLAMGAVMTVRFALVAPTSEGAQRPNLSGELEEDLTKLDSIRLSRKLDVLEATIERESAKWQKRDREALLTYMFKACSIISSYDLGDQPKQAIILNRYSISVLTSGELSFLDLVHFMEFLTWDPVGLNATDWQTLRKQKAKLWLTAWQRVAKSIDPKFDFNDRPLLSVPTPPGAGLPAGVSPQSINDAQLRKRYEKAIAENNAKNERYNQQAWLKQNGAAFIKNAERYLINAYSREPHDTPELEQLLNEYIDDKAVRDRILGAVNR